MEVGLKPRHRAWLVGAALSAAVLLCFLGSALTPAARASAVPPNSADRLTMWIECDELASLSDTELDTWKSRGVDGFACMVRHLRGMGGTQDFTGDPSASLAEDNYRLQRGLRDSRVVERMRARGMKAYLGVWLVNYWNGATPLREWFDDGGWTGLVLPKMADVAAAAKQLGFAGLAFDQELYPQHAGSTATWAWDYPGNGRSESEVRAKARQRGQELMRTLVDRFAGLELLAYDVQFQSTWGELVQREVNGIVDAFGSRLDVDFWDGLTSVQGYGALRLVDAIFYKTPHLGSWETAFQYHYNRLYAYLSRRLSNWEYASSRLSVSPFSWIDRGPCGCAFEDARPPEYVAEQLDAFRKWGMDGEFADFSYGGLRSFDYSPYASAMSSASTPAVVDSSAPSLTVTSATESSPGSGSIALNGTATDNLALRTVRWSTDDGRSGTAKLDWHVDSGDYRSGYVWHTRWSASIPAQAGSNAITVAVEDIKGLTTTRTVEVTPGELPPPPAPTSPPPPEVPTAPAQPARPRQARPTERRPAPRRRAKRPRRKCSRKRGTRARRGVRRRCAPRSRARRAPRSRARRAPRRTRARA